MSAEVQALLQAMQQQTAALLQQQQQQQQQQLEAFKSVLQQQQAQHQEQVKALTDSIKQMRGSSTLGLVDVKGIAKPQELNNKNAKDKAEFRTWRLKFCNWVESSFPAAKPIFEHLETNQETQVDDDVIDAWATNVPDVERISAQLYATLVSVAVDQPLDLVKNSHRGKGQGFDAMRRLNKRYDPKSDAGSFKELISLMATKPQPMDLMISALERHEEQVRHYEERAGEKVSDSSRRCCLYNMLVEPLKTHIDLNIAKFTNYALLREACVSYCEVVQQQQAANGPQPMDVSSLQQSIDALQTELASLKGSKGKGKGKGKDAGGKGAPQGSRPNVASSSSSANGNATTKRFEGNCRFCNKKGHKEEDCWTKNPDLKPSKAGGKGQGKGQQKQKPPRRLQALEDGPLEDGSGAGLLELGSTEVCSSKSRPSTALDATSTINVRWAPQPKDENWQQVWLTVDSGAASSACPEALGPKVPVEPSPESLSGRRFKTASGQLIPDLGFKALTFQFEELKLAMKFNATKVHKPLLAVWPMCDNGHAVHLEKGNSYIQLKTGRKLKLYESKGLYLLPLWLDVASTGGVDRDALELSPLSAESGAGREPGSASDAAPAFCRQAWGQTRLL